MCFNYLFIAVTLIFIFSGCSNSFFSPKTNVIIQEQVSRPSKLVKKAKKQKFSSPLHEQTFLETKNDKKSIKGKIVHYDYLLKEGKWYYEIDGTAENNNKLKRAGFTANNFSYSAGDFVYASIYKGKLQDMYLIKRSTNNEKASKEEIIKTNKNKKTNLINIPKEHVINID